MADEPQNEQIDQRTAAGRRIKTLLAERKEMRAHINCLTMQLSQVQQHNVQLLSDARLGPAQIHNKALQVAAHRQAMADTIEHGKKFDEFRSKVADLVAKNPIDAEATKGIGIPNGVVRILIDHEHGPRLAHHLMKNPEIAKELVSKPPHLQAAHVGQIAAELDAAGKRPRVSTSAPAPVDPVKGASSSKDYRPNSSYQEYKALRSRGAI